MVKCSLLIKLYLKADKSDRFYLCCMPLKLILICILMQSYLLYATPDHKENLRELRNRIQVLQKDLSRKEKSKLEAADALRESERAISNANRKLTELTHEKRQTEIKLKRLQAKHKRVKTSINVAQTQLDKLLYQQYLGGQQKYLRLLLNQQDPNQIARNIHYYKHLSLARSENIRILRINQKKLEILTRTSRKQMDQLTAIQTEYSKQTERLAQEKTKRQMVLSQISEKIIQQRQEIDKLKHDEKRIANLVEQINKLLTKKNTATPLYNNKLPNTSKEKQPFVSLKGRLYLPVRGELVSRFGSPRSGKHITWNGLFIRSPSGNDIKAIADGRIVFADWLRGFGNLMIVDHGSGYMSLYGNNETLYKQVGDIIRGGDVIAAAGNSGGNPDSGLYFELRHKGKPFDPLTWIKIE